MNLMFFPKTNSEFGVGAGKGIFQPENGGLKSFPQHRTVDQDTPPK
jgi:hypothetical protein